MLCLWARAEKDSHIIMGAGMLQYASRQGQRKVQGLIQGTSPLLKPPLKQRQVLMGWVNII